jgi:RimJ/RimL family protein N-acetyltransferase
MSAPPARGTVETARLLLEPIRPEHAAELIPIMLDARVADWFKAPEDPMPVEDDVIAYTKRNAAEWTSRGIGFWMMRDRHSGDAVGRGGLKYTLNTGVEQVEVGWAVAPARWGQGLATEMANAAIAYGWEELDLSELIAYTMTHNIPSRRVMEKTGFAYERDFLHVKIPHALYRRIRC